jgi:16S rRNA U1498 N3-methylase RsmE
MVFSFVPGREAPPLRPVTLILGFPRPIQVNRILKDLCSLGVRRILMAPTDLGEKSYADSTIFRERDFLRPLLEGAEQAGNPRLPETDTFPSLDAALAALGHPVPGETRWALDPYRAEGLFGSLLAGRGGAPDPGDPGSGAGEPDGRAFVLAVGSERGWTDRELGALAASAFRFASLGDRILRTETACAAAVTLALASLGLL